MIPKLRPYQKTILKEIIEAKKAGFMAPLVVSPTGSGKTIIFAFLALDAYNNGKRVLILVHRREILHQTVQSLYDFGVQAGVIASGTPMTSDLIQVAMISTLSNRLNQIIKPDLIITDEAHHSVAGQWMKIQKSFPDVFRVGFTATPERLSGEGLEICFDTMILGPSTRWLVQNGFLARPRTFIGRDVNFTEKIKITRGDYDKEDQMKQRRKRVYIGNVITHYRKHLDGLPVVCFCVNIEHCEIMQQTFIDNGYRAATVHGKMKRPERDKAIEGLGTGEIQVICSCDVISEGVDIPVIAGVIMLRKTKSLALYLQQCGRSLRLFPGKTEAIILDHAGNYFSFGSVLLERDWSLFANKRNEREGITPPETTICPKCGGCFEGRLSSCPDCGFNMDNFRLKQEGKKTPEEIEGILEEVQELQTEAEKKAFSDQANAMQNMTPEERRKAMLANLYKHGPNSDRIKALTKINGYNTKWANVVYKKKFR